MWFAEITNDINATRYNSKAIINPTPINIKFVWYELSAWSEVFTIAETCEHSSP